MPKFNATLTNAKLKHDKEGNEIPQQPVVIEAADAPAAKTKAIAQIKPEAAQDVEISEVVEASVV